MERVRFLDYQGNKVLLLDFTNCTEDDVFDMMAEVQTLVAVQPPKSVLVLADYTGGSFSREAVRRMKEVAARDKPYVNRAAVVGAASMPQALYRGIEDFSSRDFPAFATREEALAWLVSDKEQQQVA